MAMFFSNSLFYYIVSISILLSASFCLTKEEPTKEKVSQFQVYWQDVNSGSAPTAVTMVKPAPNAKFMFGSIVMTDDPLTLGPQMSSKEVGRAQGFYAYVSQETFATCLNMNFLFTYGEYNGSSITIVGNNQHLLPVREVPVIGGTGLFRFARGYAQLRTISFIPTAGKVTVGYNITVIHY